MLQVIPISFGGLGVREGASVLFLHWVHVSPTRGKRLPPGPALVGFAPLAVSLVGAPAFAIGNDRRSAITTPEPV